MAAQAVLKREFGESSETSLVHGGTGANVVALGALLHPWESVLCAATAHINVDECGAPERFLGCKLVPLATPDGKLRPEVIRATVTAVGVDHAAHHVQPRVISISQSTEYGTVYRPEEIAALSAMAREHVLGYGLIRKHPDPKLATAFHVSRNGPPRSFNLATQVKSDLATAVYQAVSAAGMSFPFPQREVRIISDQSSESTMVQAAGDDKKS